MLVINVADIDINSTAKTSTKKKTPNLILKLELPN